MVNAGSGRHGTRGRIGRGAALLHAFAVLLAALACCGVRIAHAQQDDVEIHASVDRATPRLNESLTYVLTARGRVRGEPDITPLTEMFEVLRTQESTRIQIVNGRAEQIAEWIYLLMPRRPGKALIPPIEVGGRYSNAVEIEVLPPADTNAEVPGEIFLEVEVAPQDRVYVQSQIVFTLRLFIGTMTGRAGITPPEIVEGDAIIERLGDDVEYRVNRGGRDFTVRERLYAIFPQRAGKLTIGPATFEAMVIPPRGFSRVQRFTSEPIEIEVLPAVPPPPSHPSAAWLPAKRLEITERWAGGAEDPPMLTVGVPTTRSLTIVAEGLLETQLPELAPAQADGVRLYADRPELSRASGPGGLVATRVERYAVLPQSARETTLPPIELPWFDVERGRWEIASVPARTLKIAPGSEPASPPAATPAPVTGTPSAAPSGSKAGPWPALAAVFAVGWMLTAFFWWRAARRDARAVPGSPGARTITDRSAARIRDACKRNDPAAARDALLAWAAERFPESPPRSLGALAARVPEPMAAALSELDAALYAPHRSAWNGEALAAAFASRATRITGSPRRRREPLLPLYR
ncbi:MAG: BatD family protein [Gammaproteobacteria bacterium]